MNANIDEKNNVEKTNENVENEKPKMKTLANCNTVEFLQQTAKIKKAVEKYLKDTEILKLRKRMPELTGKETKIEKQKKLNEQGRKNISDMLDLALEKYPERTAEILGLLCFIEPSEVKNHKGIEFITPALELIQSEEVASFFTLFLK